MLYAVYGALLVFGVGAFASPTRNCAPNCERRDVFEFASYYGSDMVLQRAPSRAVIWGYAVEVGDLVNLDVDGEEYSTNAVAGPSGLPEWSIKLAARAESNDPVSITATSLGVSISLDNVLFGDVFICSGQSNMVHQLQNMDDAEPDIEDVVNYPNVRTFWAATETSQEPQYDLIRIQRGWALPTPDNMRVYSAICWLYGKHLNQKYDRPIGLIQSAFGGTRIEAWSSPDALDICFPDGVSPGEGGNAVSGLYNAMIHPFLPMPIYGAIWYQGESNAGAYATYACAVREMVNDWRAKWVDGTGGETNPSFPFGQVQLAGNANNANPSAPFPELRWAQAGYVGYVPNDNGFDDHFMAVAADLPDFDSPHGSIHPRYKRQIAQRLALGAYQVAYNDPSEGRFQGPFPTSFTTGPGSLTVTFDDGNADIEIRESEEDWTVGYEVCCATAPTTCANGDVRWQAAAITSSASSAVTLDINCEAGEVITGLKYIWRESPCELEMCPVYSTDNDLPAAPFRYDGLIDGNIQL